MDNTPGMTDTAMLVPMTENFEHLRQLQHFAELGRLSASLLHEISNPLTAALLHLEQGDISQLRNIHHIRRNILLLHRYVEAARQQLRQESTATSFCIRPQVKQLQRIVAPLAKQADTQLIIDAIPHCRLRGDPVKLQQILANLITNAIDAYRCTEANSTRLISVRLLRSTQALTIRVTDWGEGIPAEHLASIFKPFYTTKRKGRHGVGIGLAIVKQYVTADFQGTMQVTSSRRHGTSFTIKLPATDCRGPQSTKP